jgi:hypothetical protein
MRFATMSFADAYRPRLMSMRVLMSCVRNQDEKALRKTWLLINVYRYAKNCLDIVFLSFPGADAFVKRK